MSANGTFFVISLIVFMFFIVLVEFFELSALKKVVIFLLVLMFIIWFGGKVGSLKNGTLETAEVYREDSSLTATYYVSDSSDIYIKENLNENRYYISFESDNFSHEIEAKTTSCEIILEETENPKIEVYEVTMIYKWFIINHRIVETHYKIYK